MIDATLERLGEIGETGRVDEIPVLTAHLLGATSYSDDALRALDGVLARCGPEGLVAIETRVRRNFGGWSEWSNLASSHAASVPRAVQRLATFHPSGRVREAAVKAIALRADPVDLPYLLLRMNDWVLPVATRARTAVVERLNGDGADWVIALPVIRYLRSTTRRDLRGVLDAVQGFLASPAARDALRKGLREGSRGVRRAALGIVERLRTSTRSRSFATPPRTAIPSSQRRPPGSLAVCSEARNDGRSSRPCS